MASLVVRTAAAQATLDRYLGKEFRWGKADCVHLVNFCLRQLGIKNQLKGLAYTSLLGAKRALAALHATSLEEVLDRRFERIPPASAIVGDIVALEGSADDLPGLGIHLGDDAALAFIEVAEHPEVKAQAGVVRAQPTVIAAWRSL